MSRVAVMQKRRRIKRLLVFRSWRAAKGEDASRFARNVAGSFILKVTATALAFLTSLLLARLLGAEGYGVYAYVSAWIILLAVPANLGFDQLVVRQLAVHNAREEWSLMRALLREAHKVALLVSVVASAVVAVAVRLVVDAADAELRKTFWIALLSLPLLTLINLRVSIAQGLGQIVRGQVSETLIRPAFFIVAIICASVWFGTPVAPSFATGIVVVAMGVSFLIGGRMLRGMLPAALEKIEANHETTSSIRRALPLLVISGLSIANTQVDTLMLGAIRGTDAVGIYNVAARAADLISFSLVAVNLTLAPRVASLWAKRDVEQLQRVTTKSVRVIALAAVPTTLCLIVFGRVALSLFGSEFVAGYAVLVILSIGQLVNALMGSVGLLLLMTNHARQVGIGLAASLCLNGLLSLLLIPVWEAEGAAIGRVCGLVLWNALLAIEVRRRLGVNATVFKIIRGNNQR